MASQHSFLFLDIDGVLNTTTDLDNDFSDTALQTLQQIVRLHHCQIVLSSTWRLRADSLQMISDVLKELFVIHADDNSSNSHLHPMLLTPDLKGMGTRCDEIVAWLQQHVQQQHDAAAGPVSVPRFCILDDQDVLVSEGAAIRNVLQPHFVQTVDEVGLTPHHLPQVASALQHTPLDAQQWCSTILAHDYMAPKAVGAARVTAADAPSRNDFVK